MSIGHFSFRNKQNQNQKTTWHSITSLSTGCRPRVAWLRHSLRCLVAPCVQSLVALNAIITHSLLCALREKNFVDSQQEFLLAHSHAHSTPMIDER